MNTVNENSEAFIKARQAHLVKALKPHLPEHALLWEPEDTIPYECDGLAAYRQMPLAVALPENEAQAVARQTDKGRDAARVAVEMALLMKTLT